MQYKAKSRTRTTLTINLQGRNEEPNPLHLGHREVSRVLTEKERNARELLCLERRGDVKILECPEPKRRKRRGTE